MCFVVDSSGKSINNGNSFGVTIARAAIAGELMYEIKLEMALHYWKPKFNLLDHTPLAWHGLSKPYIWILSMPVKMTMPHCYLQVPALRTIFLPRCRSAASTLSLINPLLMCGNAATGEDPFFLVMKVGLVIYLFFLHCSASNTCPQAVA